MRLTLAASWFSIDVTLFEQTETETDPVRAVVGSPWPADSTIAAPVADALEQVPEDRHRGTGFTA